MSETKIDYESLGLKVGLEIHQQLDVGRKLFCKCPAILEEGESVSITRYLRPTRSELGDVDPAALFEWRRGRFYEYQSPIKSSCLVEADEEPPHGVNHDALAVAIAVAMTLNSHVFDEIHVMRKVVIDGSNTSGFQRTALIAVGGWLEVNGRRIPIETICLEEDAARKVGEEGAKVVYRLDRLGIPLIEIATAPVIGSPEEARDVALAIGRFLRLTGRVKRGLGTIRQDLNVSIRGGAKTEIKGVQRLELIPKVVHYEVLRQLNLLKVRDELKRRGLREEDITLDPVELTGLLRESKSRVLRRALDSGGVILGLKLPRMKGLLGFEVAPGKRFGSEIADYVRFWSGAGGLIHSDELPGYGISFEELQAIYKALRASPESDAFIIVADDRGRALKALASAVERVKAAFKGVPEETRAANEDGTTRYMRPRPGAARMYPETDIPPVNVTEDLLREAEKIKPEPLNVKLERLTLKHGLSRELALEALSDPRLDLIEKLIEKHHEKIPASVIASIFIVTLRGLKGKGVDVEAIPDERIEELAEAIARGVVAKEAAETILEEAAKNPEKSVDSIIETLGLKTVTEEEAIKIIDETIKANMEEVKAKGHKAAGLIMGRVMEKLRGKMDGRKVSELVKKRLEHHLHPSPEKR
ncbi:MAG: Glu-tRNA(Gln) amidotransferase subunit GatE [Thermoprotei archaeon]|nr:Glu-tRNA(Gln) amidotransferase subunit GatE [Thermoprotei archaeon]